MRLRRSRSHPSGAIVWEGASRIDGQPITLIVTGLFNPSNNPKTGVMHQTWILCQDIHPNEAVQTGRDKSICGICPFRLDPLTGKRICYVNLMAPGQIYKAYLKSRYPKVELNAQGNIWFDLKPLRVGAYGDPAAVPVEVWLDWLDLLKAIKIGWTGYTRRWMMPENDAFKSFLMASVFDEAEQSLAHSLGWKTYRVIPTGLELPEKSVICPGSEEANYQSQCRDCLMCQGTSKAANVFTYVHGYQSKLFSVEAKC